MDRRSFLDLGSGALASLGLSAAGLSNERLIKGRSFSSVDANLVGFESSDGFLSSDVRAALKLSGLTLVKITLNGDGDYAAAVDDIHQAKMTIRRNEDLLFLVESNSDIARTHSSDKIGVILSFESVEMLDGRLDIISDLYSKGVRIMQLTYNGGSPYSSGALSTAPSLGLTVLGRTAVDMINSLGITLDVQSFRRDCRPRVQTQSAS